MGPGRLLHCTVTDKTIIRLVKSGQEICPSCSQPMMFLDHRGRAIKINEAFRIFWNADTEKILQNPGYCLYQDPAFRKAQERKKVQRLFQGESVQFELSDYSLPTQFKVSTATNLQSRRLLVSASPLMEDERLVAVGMFYHVETPAVEIKSQQISRDQSDDFSRSLLHLKHDINNPLLLIIGHAQLMMSKREELPSHVVQRLEKILSSAEKIRKTVVHHGNARDAVRSVMEPEVAEIP